MFLNSLLHFYFLCMPTTKANCYFQNVLCPEQITQERYKNLCNMNSTAVLFIRDDRYKLSLMQQETVIISCYVSLTDNFTATKTSRYKAALSWKWLWQGKSTNLILYHFNDCSLEKIMYVAKTGMKYWK